MIGRVPGFGVVSRAVLLILAAACLAGCGTTRQLPTYEPPLARTEFQTVRTTAYTHTEADHLQYGQRNALGGTLHAAGPPTAPSTAVSDGYVDGRATAAPPYAFSPSETPREEDAAGFHYPPGSGTVPVTPSNPPAPLYSAPLVYGSAAADWSRWPAGTVFRILTTGQLYRIDDYGWALAGRNTIDLYMPTRATMDAWAVRRVPIQIVQWGDRDESLRLLRGHDKYRHIRRMVLELEGKSRAAARLE